MKKQLKGEPIALAYYSRHNLPQVKTKIVSMATLINRNFYRSLRKRGRTHLQILRMIQSERVDQFIKDIQPLSNSLNLKPARRSTIPFWKKLVGKFKFLFTILLLVIGLNSVAQDTPPKSSVVSVVSAQKDTLYLANNPIGYEIEDVWCNYLGKKPIIIFKSPDWIIRENNIRKEEKEK